MSNGRLIAKPTSLRPTRSQAFLEAKGVPVIASTELTKEELIGKGQYGQVYRGKCRGEQVAVKELDRTKQHLDEKIIRDFQKEVEIMTQLHHPNVVLLMGCCVEGNTLAIVQELLEGNLKDIVHNRDIKLSNVQRIKFALDIAQGMAWLHNAKPHQIIHRDLKLTNLLVDANWKVKVCDFGLSELLKTDFLQDHEVAVGSALWMSPEVLLGQKLTDKIDVYSYGLVLWELWSRVEPYQEFKTIKDFREAVCYANYRPNLKKYNIPPVMQTIISRCWAADPRERPSFVGVIEVLRDALVDIVLGPADPAVAQLWMKQNKWRGKIEIKYESFVKAICRHLDLKYEEKKLDFACLKALLAHERKKGTDSTPMVHIERLALVLAWFGPLISNAGDKKPITFLDRIINIMKYGWFFGDMEREECETLLTDLKKKAGTFLVRVNLGGSVGPEVSPFTISKVNKSGNVEHHRVYHLKNYSGYYIQVKTKENEKRNVESLGGLDQLVKKLKKKRILRKDGGVPGQKYKKIFLQNEEEQNATSIYLEADNYSNDSSDGFPGIDDDIDTTTSD